MQLLYGICEWQIYQFINGLFMLTPCERSGMHTPVTWAIPEGHFSSEIPTPYLEIRKKKKKSENPKDILRKSGIPQEILWKPGNFLEVPRIQKSCKCSIHGNLLRNIGNSPKDVLKIGECHKLRQTIEKLKSRVEPTVQLISNLFKNQASRSLTL